MRFFFDNNLSPHLAASLHALLSPSGIEVVHLREKFDPSTPDVVWVKQLGDEGDWIVISGDLRITRNALEKKVWRQSALTGFFLAKGWISLTPLEQAWRLIKHWPAITQQAGLVQSGATFLVPLGGKLKQI